MTSAVRFILVGLCSAADLGLAVLGWSGFTPFFAHPALVALAIVLLALSTVASFAGGSLSPGIREDRSNRWVIAIFTAVGLLDGYLPASTDRREFGIIDGDAVRWVGVALFAVGGALRLWPVFVLGRRFSGLVAIQRGHTLITNGIYSVIRHPSYLGLLINSLGWGLAFRSGVGVLPCSGSSRTHPRRRETAAHTVWQRVRSLPTAYIETYPANLLTSELQSRIPT